MSSKLRIIAFSDYRVQDIDLLMDFLQKMEEKPDLILYAGDDIDRFVEHKMVFSSKDPRIMKRGKMIRNRFEEIATLSKLGLCAVIGNDDFPTVREYIQGKNVHSVQKDPFVFGDYVVIGIEGAIDDPKDKSIGIGFTLYSESTLKKHLANMKKKIKNKKMIILSHSPPRNTLDLAYRFGIRNIGSKALKEFIEKNQNDIPLVVCGHVHLQGGKNTTIGKTSIVNAASHDNLGEPGRIAIIDISENNIKIGWHEMYGIEGIFGIGPVTYQKFKEAGIMTVDKLHGVSVEELCKYIKCNPNVASKFLIRAKASYEKKIIILERMISIEDDSAFLDIETDLAQKLVWLIGIYFRKTNEFVQLVAHEPSQEKSMLKEFLNKMRGFKGKIYTFSGTRFDERVIKNRLGYHKMDSTNLSEFVDLAGYIQRSFAFPLKSYGLKSIASYFGYNYRHQDLSGMTVALEYLHNYQKTKDKKLMKKLLEYNEDDIYSLPWIMEKLSLMIKDKFHPV
ncbi:MAG: TM0106 family RecB-like putative nuclease [Thaumarchaeota archaeon]|nr:TM0106 family RecB-like putative nuclease [Nitrososphaerota archaeon]